VKIDFIDLIKHSAEKKIIYSLHALDEMNSIDELITTDEVRYVVFNGEIIENYQEDKRGHSCLMFGVPYNKRAVHIVCAPKDEYLAIITAYIPSLEKWEAGFKTRREK
jgi:hypothetical protein